MNFSLNNNAENTYLQIAWAAGTVGLNPTRSRKKLLKRNTILSFDIPKLCRLVHDSHTGEPMMLKTKASLLYGVSKIMRQKTCFLYEDSLQLYHKLQTGLALPTKTDNIDLQRPITSKKSITLKEIDDLLEFQTSVDTTPLSNLFQYRGDTITTHVADEEICSVLQILPNSIDLPEPEADFSGGYMMPSYAYDGTTFMGLQNNDFPMEPDEKLFTDMMDYDMDELIDYGPFDDTLNPPQGDHSTPDLMDDGIFAFPNTLNAADIRRSPSISTHGSFGSRHQRSHSGGSTQFQQQGNLVPPLIREEDEVSSTTSSVATEIYSGIVPDSEIVVSPVPPIMPRPRIMRRVMMANEQDTVLPWSFYTSTAAIVNRDGPRDKKKKSDKINELRIPTIVYNPFQKSRENVQESELVFMQDDRSRLFYPAVAPNEMTTEFARRSAIERARRDRWYYRFSAASSSGSNAGDRHPPLALRSNSDFTSPDMHNLELGDLDQVHDNDQQQPDGFENFQQGQDYGDDPIDYGYLNFDTSFQNALMDQQQKDSDEQRALCDFTEELYLFIQPNTNNRVKLDDLLQLKDRPQVAKSFYYILDLASKNKIRPFQSEPFGTIDVELLSI